MLNSVKTITDLIVVNDTGSTDGTQELIKKFGLENNIPTYSKDLLMISKRVEILQCKNLETL
jgi:glycosyltransferase involved in cell wall biosynthesis